jgi:hypothetical protein
MGSPNCHGLDHHLGVMLWKTRSDVTCRCGKMMLKSQPKVGLGGGRPSRAKVRVRLGQPLPLPCSDEEWGTFRLSLDSSPSVTASAFVRTQLISCRLPKADSALLWSSLFHHLCRFVSFSSGGFSVGEGVPLPRPGIQVVHGTVPQKCVRNTLPARSSVLYRPAIEGLRCHPLPTSSTRAPGVTPN